MDSECQGKVLLVGDGDFSFTLSLLKNFALQPSQVITSNIETDATIQQHQLAAGNMNDILHMGALVFLEADARELHIHPTISKYKYDRIIFNFPLADRFNIKKNRSLLADFFASCAGILAEDGQVMVTLCKGQGGTPADNPVRSWHNSWQVVAMATNSGFALTDIVEFDASKYPEYHSVGFRFQDKSFNTTGGLTHVFEKVSLVDIEETTARSCLQYKNAEYSCSSYIMNMRKRNLLLEDNNPVSYVSTIFKNVITENVEAVMQDINDDFLLVKGHRSGVVVKPYQADEASPDFVVGGAGDALSQSSVSIDKSDLSCDGESHKELDGDHLECRLDVSHRSIGVDQKTTKAMKEEFNVRKQKKEEICPPLAHSISFDKTNPSKKFKSDSPTNLFDMLNISFILPSEAEAVYSAVKHLKSTQNDLFDEINRHPISSEDQVVNENTACSQEDPSQRVFHLRTSLLEIFRNQCSSPSSVQSNGDFECDKYKVNNGGNSTKQCIVLTGQCFQPCDIGPGCLPVRHQMMMLCKSSTPQSLNVFDGVTSLADQTSEDPETSHTLTNNDKEKLPHGDTSVEEVGSEPVFTKVITAWNNNSIFSEWCLDIKPDADHNCTLQVQGLDQITNLKTIHLKHCGEEDSQEVSKAMITVGVMFQADIDGSNYDVCLLTIDNIASKVCSLPDVRLLWSRSQKFFRQFDDFTDFPCVFKPINLHPLKYVHDFSFWLKDTEDTIDMSELLDVVRCVAGDLVIRVEQVDSYKEATSGKYSHCYRFHFMSYDQALPYLTSWKLQSMIRIEVARRLAVTLR